jgi:uncharacterized protein DUF4157
MKAVAHSAGCSQKQGTGDTVRAKAGPASLHQVLRSPGKPLDPETRSAMEPHFGHDFSRVRVHVDGQAAASADSMGALAYTVGRHMVFAEGQYAPATPAGKQLLAHELAHTVQQRAATEVASIGELRAGGVGDPLESEAEHASRAAVFGAATMFGRGQVPFLQQETAPVLRRQPRPGPKVPDVPPLETTPKKEEGIIEKKTQVECGPLAYTKLPCTPKPVSNADFLKLGAPQDALGYTFIHKDQAIKAPEVKTKVVGKSPEVVILPTKAGQVTCESYYVKAGTEFTRRLPLDPTLAGQKEAAELCNGAYTATVKVEPDGAKRAMEAEMEHCADYKYAFDITLGCYEKVINGLAKSKTKFPSEKAAVDAVTQQVGLPPDQWGPHYLELLLKSGIRDDKDKKWHTPIDEQNRIAGIEHHGKGYCTARNKTVVDKKSYPDVGRHPSSQIIK